jgi:DNA-binding MarR family transcriptional regulator
LAKLIKEDAGNIQRELKRLEKAGFLTSERQGNTKVYSTNKQFPIFRELQSIVLKSQRSTQQKRVTG